jgi:hypothetical protein
VPTALLFKSPVELGVLPRLSFSIPLALILSQRLADNHAGAVVEWGHVDFLIGLGVGIFIALFMSAATKASVFFAPISDDSENSEDPWRKIIDSFFFIFLMLLFMAMNLERNLLEVLATEGIPVKQLGNSDIWAKALTDLSWLALKVSSFGFIFALTKTLFEEVYRRIGGESLKLIFSVCTWLVLLVMSPFLIPSFSSFVSSEMAELWKKWMGAAL